MTYPQKRTITERHYLDGVLISETTTTRNVYLEKKLGWEYVSWQGGKRYLADANSFNIRIKTSKATLASELFAWIEQRTKTI